MGCKNKINRQIVSENLYKNYISSLDETVRLIYNNNGTTSTSRQCFIIINPGVL